MRTIWRKQEIYGVFWREKLKGKDRLENLGAYG